VRSGLARALGCCLILLLTLVGCTDDTSSSGGTPPETSSPPTGTPTTPIDLTFGVYGVNDEIAAYTLMATHFDTVNDDAVVDVESWPTHDGLREALANGDPLPDVFLVSRRDLRSYLDNGLTRPVDTLLDERGVDFGDVYARDALTAFSSDNRLQCMPYGVSPQVIFYNSTLVDFDKMAVRGLDAPSDSRRWSFDQFVAAADFAARPSQGTKGVSVAPTLRGLAPFVYSGGGDLFDDDSDPRSLAFSGDGTRAALETTLSLLRDPKVTLTEEELAKRTPMDWFKLGKLGMIAGSRALVPELRKVPGLQFDVMPLPSLEGQATVGDISGLCIAKDAESPAVAADFLVYATSSEAVAEVARSGYLQPANQEVALSDDFLQPTKEPLSASVFNDAVNRMVIPPLLDTWEQLETAVAPYLQVMFFAVPFLDLVPLTEEIDAASVPILDPESVTPSPSEGVTASGSTPSPTP
jgi:multiple sugar transport system substrate-binding protein